MNNPEESSSDEDLSFKEITNNVSTNTQNRLDDTLFLVHKTYRALFETKDSFDHDTNLKTLALDKYKITNILLQKNDDMSKLEYMLNMNNWMDKSFAHQGMPSPNDFVVMEEKNLLYSK